MTFEPSIVAPRHEADDGDDDADGGGDLHRPRLLAVGGSGPAGGSR